MSVVKETLRQQDASFISLREVLELLTKDGEGCTLAEAATFLSQKLKERDAPALFRWNPITRQKIISTTANRITLLAKAINLSPVDLDDDVPF